MKDLRERLDKLRADARNFALIARSATDESQRELYGRVAEQLALEALELEQVVKSRNGNLGSGDPPNVTVLKVSSRRGGD